MKSCDWCGTEFEPYRWTQRFCCPAHGQTAGNARRKGGDTTYTKACKFCGQPFTTTLASQRYCPDQECRAKAMVTRRPRAFFDQPREFNIITLRALPDGTRVIMIFDTHHPFRDRFSLDAFELFWDTWQPQIEIYGGDHCDFYPISSFDKNPTRAGTLQDDLDMVKAWLSHRRERNPSAKAYWIDGNHEDRLRTHLWRSDPALASLRGLTVPVLLGLEEMGIEYLPYMSQIDLLGFLIEHGHLTSTGIFLPPVSHRMAKLRGSSGLCGHSHHASAYHWTDYRGTHAYYEGGCLCLTSLEYAAWPNWQQIVNYGVVYNNKLHVRQATIYLEGFWAEGEFYPRKGR